MKLQKNDPAEEIISKIRSSMGEETYHCVLASFATMADIMARYLMYDPNMKPRELPTHVLYAILQTGSYIRLLSMSLHSPDELKGAIEILHMSPYDVQNDSDAEDRFIFLVKTFYESLKKEGKLE